MSPHRRVVVTGIGAVSPLGSTFEETWRRLLQRECGVVSLDEALNTQQQGGVVVNDTEWELSRHLPCQVAAVCSFNSSFASRNTSRVVEFALAAAKEASLQARLEAWLSNDNKHDSLIEQRRNRIGVSIGSGMSSVREVVNAYETIRSEGLRKLSPHFVPKVLNNSPAGRVSIQYGAKGPNLSATTACAAGGHAIGDAFQCIRDDRADVMLAGGAEACIDAWSLAGFSRLRALSTSFNETPEKSSRPFDKDRDGFVMGEGSAVLVLEELQHAMDRLGISDPTGLIEIAGFGMTGDAYHATAPDEEGRGAERAMEMALRGCDLQQIDYINAHATSTPKGDEIESLVIDRIVGKFTDGTKPVYVSSTKGATGHLLGAAGAIEAALTIGALQSNVIPPTLNLENTDCIAVHFQHVKDTITMHSLTCAMSNSFGFGGTNAALFFRKIR